MFIGIPQKILYDRFFLFRLLQHYKLKFSEIVKSFCLLLNFALQFLKVLQYEILSAIKSVTGLNPGVVFLINLINKLLIFLTHVLQSQVLIWFN